MLVFYLLNCKGDEFFIPVNLKQNKDADTLIEENIKTDGDVRVRYR